MPNAAEISTVVARKKKKKEHKAFLICNSLCFLFSLSRPRELPREGGRVWERVCVRACVCVCLSACNRITFSWSTLLYFQAPCHSPQHTWPAPEQLTKHAQQKIHLHTQGCMDTSVFAVYSLCFLFIFFPAIFQHHMMSNWLFVYQNVLRIFQVVVPTSEGIYVEKTLQTHSGNSGTPLK